jgi:hypothetical protein
MLHESGVRVVGPQPHFSRTAVVAHNPRAVGERGSCGWAGGHGRTSALGAVERRRRQDVGDVVRAAHESCPYSNATRGNIDVTLIVNGRDIKTPAAAAA